MVEIVNAKQVTKKRKDFPPSQITTFKKTIDLILNHPIQQDFLEDLMLSIIKTYYQRHKKP